MPVNVVHNERQEAAWERAKAQVRKQYPDVEEGSDRFYALTMSIYKNIAHYRSKGDATKSLGVGLLAKGGPFASKRHSLAPHLPGWTPTGAHGDWTHWEHPDHGVVVHDTASDHWMFFPKAGGRRVGRGPTALLQDVPGTVEKSAGVVVVPPVPEAALPTAEAVRCEELARRLGYRDHPFQGVGRLFGAGVFDHPSGHKLTVLAEGRWVHWCPDGRRDDGRTAEELETHLHAAHQQLAPESPTVLAKASGVVCPRCKREIDPWPLQRGDRCSPKHWKYCIRPLPLPTKTARLPDGSGFFTGTVGKTVGLRKGSGATGAHRNFAMHHGYRQVASAGGGSLRTTVWHHPEGHRLTVGSTGAWSHDAADGAQTHGEGAEKLMTFLGEFHRPKPAAAKKKAG